MHESYENRESSSASGKIKDNTFTAKAVRTKCLKGSESKLRLRRMSRDAISDAKVTDLQSVVETQPPERPLRDDKDFQGALRDFSQLAAVNTSVCP